MTNDTINLTTKLTELAQAPAPPMSIDIGRARKLGRRRRNRRRITLYAGLAAFALIVAIVTPSMLNSIGQPEPDPATTVSPDTNPMIAYASFGWLPESITRVDYGAGAHGDYVHAVNGKEGLGTHLWLTVHPAGSVPKLPAFAHRGLQQLTVPAKPVNGRTAYWATQNASDPLNGGDAFLLWQVPDGQWVELHGYYLNFADPQGVLLRVAADVTVDERALPLPVRITGLPATFRVTEATFYRPAPTYLGTGAWLLQLFYSAGVDVPAFTLEVSPTGTSTRTKNKTCKTANGIDVCVFRDDMTPGSDSPQAILDHITPLGTDERNWTTRLTG